MNRYFYSLLVLIRLCNHSAFGFSTPPTPASANVNKNYETEAAPVDIGTNHQEEFFQDRRQFFVTVVGAASVLALSEDVLAEESTPSAASSSSTSSSAGKVVVAEPPIDTKTIFDKAAKKALGGGKAGAAAAVVQVCSLMWLRTAMNYQYRYGGSLASSLKELYSDGGIPRLYQGLPFAIVQGPLTRFGDTAAVSCDCSI